MAIYPNHQSTHNGSSHDQAHPIQHPSIEAWTEQATQALRSVSLSVPVDATGNPVTLSIPLDEHPMATQSSSNRAPASRANREPMRRDSLKRRDALLKGKEGSRRRLRWENDRLLNNPWAQPPLPSDWEVHPTHPKHVVPYFLAPLWDADMASRNAADQKKRNARAKAMQEQDPASRVPRELREKLKKAKAARGLLQDLEEEVRRFVENWEKKQKQLEQEGLDDADSSEDEIVFVGRSGQMHDMPASPNSKRTGDKSLEDLRKEKLVFDSLADDSGASFGRWLVHSIASYYDLNTWSITVGHPARREAYVGIKQMRSGRVPSKGDLPRPLWCLV